MQNKRILPPTYFLVSIVVMFGLHLLLPLSTLIKFPWNLISLIPLSFGSLLNIIADRDFKKAGTSVKPFEESSVLITSGVFRLSRNPMYLGMVLMLVGEAILLGSFSPYIIVIVFALLMHFVFIIPEEKALEARFGKDYLAYKRYVQQWP
jgi:protein-S-isoprenylcysteine O-methyltransferase Ste14